MAQAQVIHHQSSTGNFNLHDQRRHHIQTGSTYPPEAPSSYRLPVTFGNSRLMAQAMLHQYRPQEYLQGQHWQPQPLSPEEYKLPSTTRTEFAAHGATYPQNGWATTMFDHGFALNNGLQTSPYVIPQLDSSNASNADTAYNQMAVQEAMGKNGFQYADGSFAMPSRMTGSGLDTDSSLSPRSYNSDNMGSDVQLFSPDPAGDLATPCTNWSDFSATSFPAMKASTSDSGSSRLSMAQVAIRPREAGENAQYPGLPRNALGATLPSPVSDTSSHRYNGLPASYGDTSPYESEFSLSQKSSPGISPWHLSEYTRRMVLPNRPREYSTTGALSNNSTSAYQVHGSNGVSQNPIPWSNTRTTIPAQARYQTRFMAPRTVDAQVQRKADDDILLEGKKEGLTYKEIRKKMHTKCAESTLRGRYRSLTKARKDRVRKPVWREIDIDLLNEFVQQDLDRIDASHYQTLSQEQRLAKVQWKKVADYINDNGGSYHFGNSTCKRKWLELNKDSKGH